MAPTASSARKAAEGPGLAGIWAEGDSLATKRPALLVAVWFGRQVMMKFTPPAAGLEDPPAVCSPA